MEANIDQKTNQISPDIVGLWGFSFATLLDNIASLGFWTEQSMMIGTAIFLGGIAQFVCGMMCFRLKDVFGLVAFTFFGLFWMANGTETFMVSVGLIKSSSVLATGWYLCLWTLFALMLTLGCLKKPKTLFYTLVFVTLLLFFKMLGVWCHSNGLIIVGSICGIICAVMAIYLAVASFLNQLLGDKTIPVK